MKNEYILTSDGELKHYGVVGMKWGVRRARKKGKTYTYQSMGTKRYKKKMDKALKKGDSEKAKKYKEYHKKSVELDRRMQDNALSNSTGKAVVKTILTVGNLGGKTYEAVKAATGESKYFSRGAAMAASYLNGAFGAMGARALYVRGYNADDLADAERRLLSGR